MWIGLAPNVRHIYAGIKNFRNVVQLENKWIAESKVDA